MQYRVNHSSTSVKLRVLLDVLGLTEASAGLIISTITDNEATVTRYRASSSEVETITTLGTYAAPTASKCRFKVVDATNHPYLYEVQLADARFAVASATSMTLTFTGAGIRTEGVTVSIDLPTAPPTAIQIASAVGSLDLSGILSVDSLAYEVRRAATNSVTILADTAEIGAALAATEVTVTSPMSSDGTMTIYNTRTYGGSAHTAIGFTASKNYTAATSVSLIIHKKGDVDTEYQTLTATVASPTSITVSGTISVDADYEGCDGIAQLSYSLMASWSGSLETISSGAAYVYDQPV